MLPEIALRPLAKNRVPAVDGTLWRSRNGDQEDQFVIGLQYPLDTPEAGPLPGKKFFVLDNQ
jgi:hypothetical protein